MHQYIIGFSFFLSPIFNWSRVKSEQLVRFRLGLVHHSAWSRLTAFSVPVQNENK